MAPTPDRLRHLLGGVALVWLLTVLAWPAAQQSPVAVAVTAALLGLSFLVCVGTLFRAKRIPVFLSLTQIALFGVLPFQISSTFDRLQPDPALWHYRFDTEPGPLDWVQFCGAHVLRAVDVLDGLEECGIDLQNVEHNSVLSGALLVAMHVAVDLFVFALIVRWAGQLWRWVARRRRPAPADDLDSAGKLYLQRQRARKLGRIQAAGLAACLLGTAACAAAQR